MPKSEAWWLLLQEFTLTNRVKDSKVEQAVAAAYKTDKFSVLGSVNPAGKVPFNCPFPLFASP